MGNGDLTQGDRVLVEATVKSVSANGTYVTVEIPVYTVRIPEDKFEPAPVAVPWHCIIPRRDSKLGDKVRILAAWLDRKGEVYEVDIITPTHVRASNDNATLCLRKEKWCHA